MYIYIYIYMVPMQWTFPAGLPWYRGGLTSSTVEAFPKIGYVVGEVLVVFMYGTGSPLMDRKVL